MSENSFQFHFNHQLYFDCCKSNEFYFLSAFKRLKIKIRLINPRHCVYPLTSSLILLTELDFHSSSVRFVDIWLTNNRSWRIKKRTNGHWSNLLYRLNTVTPSPKPEIASETVLWNLVKLFGSTNESGLRQRCAKLVQGLTLWQPEMRELVKTRRIALDHAVNGKNISHRIGSFRTESSAYSSICCLKN